MKERIILNIQKPIMKTWSSESQLMSMILSQDSAMSWIFNNYINLLGYHIPNKNQNLIAFVPKHNPMETEVPLNAWTSCPFLEMHKVSAAYIEKINIFEYIFHAIEEGYYIYLNLCQDYLKTRLKTKVHKTFIYGFDKNARVFYAADHYNILKYSLAEISFDEFRNAYDAAYIDKAKMLVDQLYDMHFIVIAKPKPFAYKFNLEWFKIQLEDYLNSTYSLDCVVPLTVGENITMYYGISTYDLLCKYMNDILENKKNINRDWRIFTLICDHKNLLVSRVEYFLKKRIFTYTKVDIEEYEELYHMAELMLNLFLKYLVIGEDEQLIKIKDIGTNMKTKEQKLLEHMLHEINNHLCTQSGI